VINTTTFTDWSAFPPATMARYTTDSPNLVAIEAYIESRWPGTKGLGIRGVRAQRGNKKKRSVHSWGAALDLSWRGLPRAVADEIIAFLIDHSAELGVQAIHDYQGCRIWRSWRPGGKRGWLAQRPSADGMGQPWGDWIHIEVTEQAWRDGREVTDRIGTVRPTLTVGATGDPVRVLQQILTERAGQDVGRPDGQFGQRTLAGWRNVAAFLRLPADDQVQGADWDAVALLDGGWARLNAAGVR
jgi:hypothetical protein